jgi:hypothetical protein
MISNFTPALFFLLNCSARNWKPLSWLVPTAGHQAGQRVEPGDLDGLVQVDGAAGGRRGDGGFGRRCGLAAGAWASAMPL